MTTSVPTRPTPSSATDTMVLVFGVLGSIGLATCIWLIFTDVPNDAVLFFNQRIFYFHVAHAFMLFLSVGVCGVASVVFLWKRRPEWDDVALAAAEVAVAF